MRWFAVATWGLTLCVIIGWPITNLVYWSAELRAGNLPTDGDSIVIPIMGSLITSGFLTPFFLIIVWNSLRGHDPRAGLLAWRGDRPLRSGIYTALLGGPAVLMLISLAKDLVDIQLRGLAWQEYILVAWFSLFAFWLLFLRAALAGKPQEDTADANG